MTGSVQAAGAAPDVWRPNAGPQEAFLRSSAFEALYGGAAGGGKSEALLVDPLRFVHLPKFRAILFRRTFPELEKSLIERSFLYYRQAFPAARYNDSKHVWRFPSGAVIYFGHLEHDRSVYDHQSAEYQHVSFDELTSFTLWQYTYMLSRIRSSDSYPVRVRAATNPGGEGHEWVMKRFGPWLGGPEWTGPRAAPQEVLRYLPGDDGETWVPKGTPGALSRVFIPARLRDNPKVDVGYEARLMALDPVTRAQLKDGNWLIKPARGLYFKRAWFKMVPASPSSGVRRIRYWDRAGTEPKPKTDPDWTVGVRLAMTMGERPEFFVEHVERMRGSPRDVEATIVNTAIADGHDVEVGIEQDPGQAGKFEASYYVQRLQGFNVRAYPVGADKVTRAGPISSQVEAENVKLVVGPWLDAFLAVLEAFPEGTHDDDVDALSGAYAALTGNPVPSYEGASGVVLGRWSRRR